MSLRQQYLCVFVSLAGVLLLASLIAFILRLRVHDGDANPVIDNLTARIKAWWVILIVAGGALLAAERLFIVLFSMLSLAALREFITLTPTRRGDYGVLFLSFFVALPVQYGLIWTGCSSLFVTLIPVYAFLILPIASLLFADTRNFLARTSETQWGLMICVFCISHVPALLTLKIPGYSDRAALLVVFLLVVGQSSDVLQYVFGMLFGRHKIAPVISPSKTVEGFVGGVLAATVIGTSLWRLTPFNPVQAAGMALTISLMGFLGGLVMSAIKRDRGIKDWSNLIKGHGGMLDRLDSVAFSAPIFFHLTRSFFTS
jgi:phosphatidate cytidylyltransferase